MRSLHLPVPVKYLNCVAVKLHNILNVFIVIIIMVKLANIYTLVYVNPFPIMSSFFLMLKYFIEANVQYFGFKIWLK